MTDDPHDPRLFAGTVIAVMTVMILILRYSITHFVINKEPWHASHIRHYVNHFIVGVTVLVVAVPEGLPLAVTLALAYSVRVSYMKRCQIVHCIAGLHY